MEMFKFFKISASNILEGSNFLRSSDFVPLRYDVFDEIEILIQEKFIENQLSWPNSKYPSLTTQIPSIQVLQKFKVVLLQCCNSIPKLSRQFASNRPGKQIRRYFSRRVQFLFPDYFQEYQTLASFFNRV
ncbi:hypothetical protein ACTA71_009133 [Dictyostelium dimigraforme]